MNPTENNPSCDREINDSLRVPLLALFGGAAVWLVVGLVLGLIAGIKFHAPEFLGGCSWFTYGHLAPAANDAVLYGFCIPAALGVLLWIFARLSQNPLALPLVPVVAANLWHLGVFIGTAAILLGDSTGHTWLEYPRAAAVLLFAAFLLIAVSAAATFGWRGEQALYPSHWFLFAALLWFPWIYSTANLLLLSNPLPRGVVQPIIGWWLANNLVFVWLALVGVGTAFYFLPKISGRPLANSGFALFGFITLIFFGTWCGIPQGAPVPAWLPTLSSVAAVLTIIPLIAISIVTVKTVCGACVSCQGGPFCFIKFGMISFVVSGILYLAAACPQYSRVLEFTWFGVGQTQLQLLGFAAMILFGAIYELLPQVMGKPLPLPKFAKLHFWVAMAGVLLFVVPLVIGGIEQGEKFADASVPFADANAAALQFLRISATGQLLILLGALLFSANIFIMTIQWKIGLAKTVIAYLKSPLDTPETVEVKS
jgi:cytochrome c oxidase cbb3-type subunit 1